MSTAVEVERSQYIGASEVAAILGRHPFLDAAGLYDVKKGLAEKRTGKAMSLGNYLEAGLIAYFADKLGAEADSEQEQYTAGRALATVDCVLLRGSYKRRNFDAALLEIKTIGATGRLPYHDQYGRGGTAEVPPHVFDQVQQQMALSGIDTAFVGLLDMSGRADVLYRVERDRAHGAALLAECDRFFNDYILPSIRPGSEQDPLKEIQW